MVLFVGNALFGATIFGLENTTVYLAKFVPVHAKKLQLYYGAIHLLFAFILGLGIKFLDKERDK